VFAAIAAARHRCYDLSFMVDHPECLLLSCHASQCARRERPVERA
jgi:hypothetical protein